MDNARRAAETVCRVLTGAGHRALFAGGCVRDRLLGLAPKDFDVATSAHPDEVEALFDHVVSVGKAFGVQVVRLHGVAIEVATFRREGPYLDGRRPSNVSYTDEKEDALRRDFTVNALFYDPATNEVLDYVDGRADLDKGLICAVGNPQERFNEDHLRLLRCVRIAAQLDFDIDPDTFRATKDLAHLAANTSPERIRDELLRMLTHANAARGFALLDEAGLLHQVLPEIAAMKGVEQPPEFHPEGDVFVHTLKALGLLENPSPTLALGVLLHDVGKPVTQTFEDRIRFNGHEKVGADMAADICARLRMSNAATERVTWLVGQHMRVAAAPEMRTSKLKRLVREEGFDELLELFRIDCAASHHQLDAYEWLRDYAENLEPEAVRPPPLLTGQDLIDLGYAPGPAFSHMLTAIEDAQLEGELTSPEEARAYVRKHWALNPDEQLG